MSRVSAPPARGVVILVILTGACSFGRDFHRLTRAERAAPAGDGGAEDQGAGDGGPGAEDRESGVTAEPDLVAHWTLDEGAGAVASDSAGGFGAGVVEGGFTWTAGRHGGALAFDGASGRVRVDRALPLATLTVAFWVYLGDDASPDAGASARLVARGYNWEVKLNANRPQFTAMAPDRHATLQGSLSPRRWYHVTFTFAPGGAVPLASYVDGVQRSDWLTYELDAAATLGSDEHGLRLGSSIDDDNRCRCRMDDVRLYRRALTAAEVAALAR